ncbi:MAG TPA: M28 family metallopeptidase [Chitinophagaceae bacterium]|nr:M28 family metallopeptidase [Chitinophagaceae bacterium]
MKRMVFLLTFSAVFQAHCGAQGIYPDRNPLVAQMVNEVSLTNLREDIDKLVSFGTRQTFSIQTNKKKGIGAAREWVAGQFLQDAQTSGGRMTVRMDRWLQNPDSSRRPRYKPTELVNVIATLRGTDTADHRIFLVSGHLDSRRSDVMDSEKAAPGANDDGSGVAALLEMARILSRQPFPATIMFVAFTGEEQGLFGSRHLAALARDSSWDITAMINNDMIGQDNSSETDLVDNSRVRVFSEGIPMKETPAMAAARRAMSGENDSKSRELARYIKEICSDYVDNLEVELIYRPDRFLRGGDHQPFAAQGYTAVRITTYYENYYHQHQDPRIEKGIEYGDLPKFMDFEYLRKNTCLNLATVACLAAAPAVPRGVKIDVSRLSNDSRLFWDPPATGRAAGYLVLMRETDQPMWQKRFFTRDLQMTVPYSRDNYFFAVQAVSSEGLKSLPVFPSIGR